MFNLMGQSVWNNAAHQSNAESIMERKKKIIPSGQTEITLHTKRGGNNFRPPYFN